MRLQNRIKDSLCRQIIFQKEGKLSGQKIGVYFGTFAPLHTGHQQQIYKTSALNEGVLLICLGL